MFIRILVLVMLWFCLCGGGGSVLLAQRPDPAVESGDPEQDAEKDLEGTVEVSFRIDASGKVQILNIAATSPQLADYVIKKLNKIQLEKSGVQVGQVIKYRFVFKKQA